MSLFPSFSEAPDDGEDVTEAPNGRYGKPMSTPMPSINAPAPTQPPDYTQGGLTEHQRKVMMEWLVSKWGKGNAKNLPVCERCHGDGATWVMGQHVLTPVQFLNGGIQLGGVVYPSVAVTCSNCGNTHFVNAITAGVLVHVGGGQLRPAEEKK